MTVGLAKSQEVSVESRGDWGTFFDAAKKLSRPISLDRMDGQTANRGLLNRNGLLFNRYFDPIRPSDPTISGGFKHVFAAISKGFPSHPAHARHLRKAREKRLFATP
ncbi:MAG: hypothetical protein AB1547_02200 [Thermodesulfobacteriota bacterium]